MLTALYAMPGGSHNETMLSNACQAGMDSRKIPVRLSWNEIRTRAANFARVW